jgi:hypothetical protein
MIQRSEEWKQAKAGKVGCSRLGDVLARGKGGAPSATRKNYMAELVCERLIGKSAEHFTSRSMDHGTETEPMARAAYEARTGVLVEEHGGKSCEDIPDWWASPDGLIGEEGGLEIKCPNTSTHLETMLTGKISTDYLYQMAGNCYIFNREWWDFVSFDPRLPENLSMFVCRFYRKDLPIEEVKAGVIQFVEELKILLEKLKGMTNE